MPKIKLGLVKLKEVPSTNFANQGVAYQEELTYKAKYLFTEYTVIKERELLDNLKANGKRKITTHT